MVDLRAKPFYLNDAQLQWVEDTLASMTLEEKLSQLFVLLKPVPGADEGQIRALMEDARPGGMRWQGGDQETVWLQNRLFQRCSRVPVLIAGNCDDGGNGVLPAEGTFVATAAEAGASPDDETAYRMGYVAGREAAAVGVNWMFNPVADVYKNWRNTIVNTRAFSSDPDRVIACARAYIRGIRDAAPHMACTCKHFPGDGWDELDPHISPAHNEAGPEEWLATYGRVYQTLIDEGLETIMTGQISLPAMSRRLRPGIKNEEIMPASLAPELLGDLLRGQMGFNGLIISDASPVSPRLYVREHAQGGTHLVLNYLFFLTSRLASLYNQLRKNRPMEQTTIQGGHLDYLLRRDGQERMETFPLYRKACMALMEDGSFSFFHFRLGGGACTINGHALRWEAGDVDPDLPGDTAVFTPYASCPDAGQSKFTYTRPVGANRINLVLLQGAVVCARDGDVLLPCFGVVLSLSRETGLPFLARCGFTPASDGYYVCAAAASVSVCLDPPEGFSQAQWDGVRWAYGGGLTLIHQGISCFSDSDTAAAHLAREGWLSPLSTQTQESDIASMVRHPRTAIGLNSKGQLFCLVFSGRSSVSLGADYREMCALARRIVPDVTELMNVDGGGSALLAIASQGHLYEYSWPSTSPASLSGMARPVNSLFVIHLSSNP